MADEETPIAEDTDNEVVDRRIVTAPNAAGDRVRPQEVVNRQLTPMHGRS